MGVLLKVYIPKDGRRKGFQCNWREAGVPMNGLGIHGVYIYIHTILYYFSPVDEQRERFSSKGYRKEQKDSVLFKETLCFIINIFFLNK